MAVYISETFLTNTSYFVQSIPQIFLAIRSPSLGDLDAKSALTHSLWYLRLLMFVFRHLGTCAQHMPISAYRRQAQCSAIAFMLPSAFRLLLEKRTGQGVHLFLRKDLRIFLLLSVIFDRAIF